MIAPKQYLNKIGVISALFLVVVSLSGWVTPVNMDEDHIGTGDGEPCSDGEIPASGACNTLSLQGVGDVDRCDTLIDGLFNRGLPSVCHRRNLVWKLDSTNPLTEWDPDLDGDAEWRLPTIKELSRLMDYTTITAIGAGTLIASIATNEVEENLTAWLISSTYRDIDGKGESEGDQNSQVLGINMTTGEIAAFNTEGSRSPFGTVTGAALKQCTAIDSSGVCSTADAAVYALVVRVETVDELLIP